MPIERVGRVVDLVFDCAEAESLARFWARVLGREMELREPGWVSLSVGENGQRMSFQEVQHYRPPRWPGQGVPQQIHIDVLVEDLAAACERVAALGATPLSEVLDPGPKPWRIYADPAGHPFCLVTSAP